MSRCPRCHLAHLAEGASTCARCGFSLTPGAPSVLAASWLGADSARRGDPPIVIMDHEGDEDEERDEGDVVPRRRAARPVGRIAIGAGVVIALGGGAVWLRTSPAPRSEVRAPDASGVRAFVAQLRAALAPPGPPATTVDRARAAAPPTVVPHETRPRMRVPHPLDPGWSRARGGRPPEPALLSVNATPWGRVFVDGRPEGDTPLIDLRLAAGSHTVRVERDGFNPYERVFDVAPGEHLRVTGIVLAEQ